MTLKVLAVAVSTLAFSVVANAAPVKAKAKVRTNLKTKVENVRTNAKTSTQTSGLSNVDALLGAATADGQESLKNAQQALNSCNGNPMIQDISKAMPSSSEQASVLRYSGVLGGHVQNCQAGEKITDAQALVNFGRLIIYVGQSIESNGAKASDGNVWAQALQKAIQTSGGAISLEEAKSNISGLQSSKCQMLKGISI